MEYDFIVVGGGIAGSILAWNLLQQKQRVLLVDDPNKNKASLIAAGIINPITGRRLSKCWELERCLAYALPFYETLEKALPPSQDPTNIQSNKLFHHRPILRILQNEHEIKVIEKRLQDPEYQAYLGPCIQKPGYWGKYLNDPLGSIEFKGGGFLDIPGLLNRLHTYFKKTNCIHNEWMNLDELKTGASGCTWNQIFAQRVVFCEGFFGKFNKHFAHKPVIDPIKGEILLLEGKFEETLNNYIINYGHWALPLSEKNIIKIGATFDRDHLDDFTPKASAQESLLKSFRNVFKNVQHFSVKEHLVGQRACTRDNRPILGSFIEDPCVYILNGLGAKAALYTPFWAHHLVQHLTQGTSIEASVNVARFLKW